MIAKIDDLRARVSGYAALMLALSVPLLLAVGQVLGTGGGREAAAMALIAALVWLERRRAAHGLGVQLAAAAGLAVACAALVWLMRGHPWQADAHMIFFAAFALTGLFCNWRPIVLYAGLIAVHHLVLNYALTEAVFPGAAFVGAGGSARGSTDRSGRADDLAGGGAVAAVPHVRRSAWPRRSRPARWPRRPRRTSRASAPKVPRWSTHCAGRCRGWRGASLRPVWMTGCRAAMPG